MVRDLLGCVDIVPSPSGSHRVMVDEDEADRMFPSENAAQRRRLMQAIADIVRAWREPIAALVAAGPQPLTRGDWLTWDNAQGKHVAKAISDQQHRSDPLTVRIYSVDRLNRLSKTGTYIVYDPMQEDFPPITRANVWLETEPPPRSQSRWPEYR